MPPPTLSQHEPVFTLYPRRIAGVLSIVTALLVIAHLVFSINDAYVELDFPGSTQLYVIFDMHGEVTVPTWYSSSVLLLCAFALAGVSMLAFRDRDHFRFHWAGLALIFLGLSVEESVDLHGAVSRQIQTAFETSGALAYPWVVPAAVLTLVVGVLYIRFLRSLDRRTRRLFIIAGALYVGGALGLEVVQAAYDSSVGDDVVYLIMVTVEETMEIAGAIVLLYATLTYLGALVRRFQVEIVPE